MPKKIVLGVTDPRSATRLMTGLPERLAAEGWDVHLVTGPGPQTDVYKNTEIEIHHISMKREPDLIGDIKALHAWRVLLKRLSPQVVMVGTPKAGFLGIVGAWLAGVPNRVYHIRGLRLESTRGLKRVILKNLEKLTCGLATNAVAVSPSLRKVIVDLGIISASKVVVLGSGSSNGVDVRRFHPDNHYTTDKADLQIDSKVPVIGFVGRITPDKGSRELIEASQLLNAQGIEHQLLIIGREDSQEEIQRLTAAKSIGGPIFTGDVEDTAPYYRLIDVLCLPTYREGFPNVVLEAGASGIPTVTTDATGAVDSVVDGYTGIIVAKRSPRQLAAALAELLSNDDFRLELGKQARDYVARHFDHHIVQSSLVKYLNGLQKAQRD